MLKTFSILFLIRAQKQWLEPMCANGTDWTRILGFGMMKQLLYHCATVTCQYYIDFCSFLKAAARVKPSTLGRWGECVTPALWCWPILCNIFSVFSSSNDLTSNLDFKMKRSVPLDCVISYLALFSLFSASANASDWTQTLGFGTMANCYTTLLLSLANITYLNFE